MRGHRSSEVWPDAAGGDRSVRGPSGAHPVLAWQQAAGNRAVAGALATVTVSRCGTEKHAGCPCADESEAVAGPDAAGGAPAVQRDEEANENNPSAEGAEGGALAEGVCEVTPNAVVVQLVRGYFWLRYPRAARHIDHYLTGGGAPFTEDVADLFRTNPRAAARVAQLIKDNGGTGSGSLVGRTTSSAVVRQTDYDNEDWRLSLGGIDQIDYEVLEDNNVRLTLLDPYEWHPAEDRGSQCIHEAMESRKAVGAKDFMSEGTAVVRLPL